MHKQSSSNSYYHNDDDLSILIYLIEDSFVLQRHSHLCQGKQRETLADCQSYGNIRADHDAKAQVRTSRAGQADIQEDR